MTLIEFRVPMPLTESEYERGQLWTVLEASKLETQKSGGGEGVEILVNEPFENYPLMGNRFKRGHYTKKLYRVGSQFPRFLRRIVPNSSLTLCEESWNAYPYVRTVLTNDFMGDSFFIRTETYHVNKSRGEIENIHELDEDTLKKRSVDLVDIGNDKLSSSWGGKDPTIDPSQFVSQKTGRGPLKGDWIQTTEPIMTCYKLVYAKFKWFGLQGTAEKFIVKTQRKLFLKTHKQIFCWIDRWFDHSISAVRKLEMQAQEELRELINAQRNKPGTSLANRSLLSIDS